MFPPEKEEQYAAVSLRLAQEVRVFFQDEKNREEFSRWYREKFGKNYEWRNQNEKGIRRGERSVCRSRPVRRGSV